jgi:hypothetical protein
MNRRTSITSIFVFVSSFILLNALPLTGAEKEPNDSMDDPDTIGEGMITGSVSRYSQNDKDIFRVDVPAGTVVFYSLKKTDTGTEYIRMNSYGSDREPLEMEDYGYYGGSGGSVDVAGEKMRDMFINHGESDHFFIIVEGSGEYVIEVKFMEMMDPDEEYTEEEITSRLEQGSETSGRVYVLEYDSQTYEDVDIYYIPISDDTTVKVKLTKTDEGNGTIYGSLSEYRHSDSVDIELDEKGESGRTDETVYVYGGEEEFVYVTVWGDGEYQIEVEEASIFSPETILLGIMGIILCLTLAMTIMPVLIVIVIIVVIVKSTSKDKKKRKRR